jgi:hypothetical protein
MSTIDSSLSYSLALILTVHYTEYRELVSRFETA